jgi:hypothetical protein
VQAHTPVNQKFSITKPIFIVGTGRCGSTALHHALAMHEETAWLSQFCDAWPYKPHVNRWAMQVLSLPLVQRYLRKLIYPVEAYRFWDHYYPGFSKSCRDLSKEDTTPLSKRGLWYFTANILTARRHRLLVKTTGWPRTGFLQEVFPDARFIHVYRDGRAVANSYLNVSWWSGWQGPTRWQWGDLSAEHREKWERYNHSFVVLAGLQWEILMSAYKKTRQNLPSNCWLEIRYEDMCLDPVGTLKKVAEFSELMWSPQFLTTIQNQSFVNTNYKWQEHLDVTQQKILNECLFDTLKEYNYV